MSDLTSRTLTLSIPIYNNPTKYICSAQTQLINYCGACFAFYVSKCLAFLRIEILKASKLIRVEEYLTHSQ